MKPNRSAAEEGNSLADSAALRRRAETELATKHTREAKRQPDTETTRLLHELQVHQIELQMQNEELEAARTFAEAGRTEAEARYAALYEFAPTGYFSFDRNGNIVRTNLAGALSRSFLRPATSRSGRRRGRTG